MTIEVEQEDDGRWLAEVPDGQKARDFVWLKSTYLSHGGPAFSREVAKWFSQVNLWSTDLRYQPGAIKRREAESVLEASRQILVWGDGRL